MHACSSLSSAQQGEWTAEKAFLDQQVCLLQQQNEEKVNRLEDSITSMQTDRQTLLDRLVCFDLNAPFNSLFHQTIKSVYQSIRLKTLCVFPQRNMQQYFFLFCSG